MLTRAQVGTAFAATCVVLATPALGACAGDTDTSATKTVTATAIPTTTASQRDALHAWWEATQVPAQEMGNAMDKISAAAKTGDFTTMGISCQEAHDGVEQFQQHMPSPDPQLTAALGKALSDYDAAARICTTAVENNNLDDFRQGTTFIDEANTYMDNAVKILYQDLGQSSGAGAASNTLAPLPPVKTVQSAPPASTVASSPGQQDPGVQLAAIARDDRPFVNAALVDRWVPQLSSKRPGVADDGVVWDDAMTLQEHLRLRQNTQYPEVRLLRSGDWSTFSAPDFWVTVVGATFPTSSGALAWCKSRELDNDHCIGRLISATHPVEGSTAYN